MAAGLLILWAGPGGDSVYRRRQNARIKCGWQDGAFNRHRVKLGKTRVVLVGLTGRRLA